MDAGPASARKTVRIDGGFAQWADVAPEYLDDLHDTTPRDHPGYGDAGRQTNATGRNDFDAVKVARDDRNVSFYARTRDPITAAEGDNWMVLLLDADGDPKTGWNGYDVMVNGGRAAGGKCGVERHAGGGHGWEWAKAGGAPFRAAGNEMHLSVPRAPLGPAAAGRLGMHFKWVDNVPGFDRGGPDPLDWIDKGDVAPNGRFNYRYVE